MSVSALPVERSPLDRSGQLNELAAALAKAQAEIKPAVKDAANPYFKSKYADLASVMAACREALTSNGLAIVQRVIGQADTVGVTTTLMHASGQFIEGTVSLTLADPTPQALGSCVTYLRRFSLASIVGVVPDDPDLADDDGEAAQGRRRSRPDPRAANDNSRPVVSLPAAERPAPPPSSARSVLKQWNEYDALRESMHVTEEAGRQRVSEIVGRKIGSVGDLTLSEMDHVLDIMRKAAGGA